MQCGEDAWFRTRGAGSKIIVTKLLDLKKICVIVDIDMKM